MFVSEIANSRIGVVMLWLTLAAGGVCLFLLEPGKSRLLPVCPFHALTGFTCPGCGSTRGMHQLLHGNLGAAFEFNPLLLLALPFLLYALLSYSQRVLRGQPAQTNALAPKYIYTIFGAVLFFWIFRNTPLYPFVS
ncbi:MAG TPA: DUF2752 domain-containing protein [Pyrinomonadaceae bacterium]|nr:DUF2752 domain-containing protein [Pyrinomonadaceae bacterium]